jgi:serine/threonine-protein kinase
VNPPARPPAHRTEPAEPEPPEAKPVPPATGGKRAGAKADKADTALPPALAEELARADEALARGNAAEAIRIAQHSLYVAKSSRAFAIMVKARCRQGDLGGARAALGQVSSAQRAPVLRDCAAHGMDLR